MGFINNFMKKLRITDDVDSEYYDEEDDYDDESEGSFGHAITGFFKGLLAFVLILLVIVFALNALDFFNVVSLDNVYEKYYDKAPGVFDTLFPAHGLKDSGESTATMTATDPSQDAVVTIAPTEEPVFVTEEPTAEPTPTPEPTEVPVTTVG